MSLGVLLLLPATAHAFPFMVAAVGSSLLPLLGLMLAALFADRRIVPLLALLGLAVLLLFPAMEQVTDYRKYMRTSARPLDTVVSEYRQIEALAIPRPGYERAVSLEELSQRPAQLVWVQPFAQPLTRGETLETILRDRQAWPADTVFVSPGPGWTAAYAAQATGRRWLRGGIHALRFEYGSEEWNGQVYEQLAQCSSCLRVAVHLSWQVVWKGFEREKVDLNLRLEDFLFDRDAALARLENYAGNKKIVLMFFGSTGETENRQWMAALQAIGLQGAGMLRTIDVHHAEPLPVQMRSFIGEHKPELLLSDLERLCKPGSQITLISSHAEYWERTTDYPAGVLDCLRENFPLDGLLPEELDDWVQEHASDLSKLRERRLVGLYLDEPGLFLVSQLREVLQRQGYAWTGMVFGYNTTTDALAPLRTAYDVVLESLYKRWPGEGRQVPVQSLLVAFIAVLLAPVLIFVWCNSRWLSLLGFVTFVLLCGLGHHAFYRYPLDEWLDPLWAIIFMLLVMLLMAQVRYLQQVRPLSKSTGLRRLQRLGLAVPRSHVVRQGTPMAFAQAAQRVGYPVIFRSDERRRENRDATSMGEYASVVVPTEEDLALLPAAWASMTAYKGARPGYLVQPFYEFERSGVIRTGVWRDGRPCVRIESSTVREAVTGNVAGEVVSELLDIEACLCSNDPLLRDVARICERYPAPALLEFGIRDGQPLWLQFQPLPDHPLLCHGDAKAQGYLPSPLEGELRGGRGTALLLSLMNASTPFIAWRLEGGRVVERRRAWFPLFALLAAVLPWRLLDQLSQRFLRQAAAVFSGGMIQSRRALRLCRLLFFVDALIVIKGDSRRIVAWTEDAADPAFAAVVSPYAQFADLPELLSGHTGEALPHPSRCRVSLLVRERMRLALGYALATLITGLRQRLNDEGLPVHALQGLTLKSLQQSTLQPVSALLAMSVENVSPVTSMRYLIASPDDIEVARQNLAGVGSVTVVAEQPWMGLFRLVPLVSCFEIKATVYENSHFMQRARLMGISVITARHDEQ